MLCERAFFCPTIPTIMFSKIDTVGVQKFCWTQRTSFLNKRYQSLWADSTSCNGHNFFWRDRGSILACLCCKGPGHIITKSTKQNNKDALKPTKNFFVKDQNVSLGNIRFPPLLWNNEPKRRNVFCKTWRDPARRINVLCISLYRCYIEFISVCACMCVCVCMCVCTFVCICV